MSGMADAMLSIQQFEEGARGFARLWESCSSTDQLWTWHPSANMLVCLLSLCCMQQHGITLHMTFVPKCEHL